MAHQILPSVFPSNAFQSPFFRSLHDEIDRTLERFNIGSMANSANGDLMPALDVSETDDTVVITAEIPGIKEGDLDVSVTGDVLLLKGQKTKEVEETKADYHLVGRQFGSFRRQIPLGFTPPKDGVNASFEDGVLNLTIKKPEEVAANTQRIKIEKK
ncbi:MAG: HSP20 family protein [Yoonia sp.]|jgi:HSP20 family protein